MSLDGYPVWVSYYSGNGNDFGYNIIFKNYHLIFTGETNGGRFPITKNFFQQYIFGDYSGFLVNVNMEGTPVIEQKKNSDIIIYPNPAKDFLFIKTNHNSNYSAIIMNLLGQEVLSISFLNTNNNRIDISKLVKGYYYLLIKDNNKINSFSFVKE